MLDDIARECNIDIETLYKIAGDRVKKVSPFTPQALKLAQENGLSPSEIAHSGVKITIDDVRAAIGQPKKNVPADAFTGAARKLAQEHNLTEADFPAELRTGKTRKSGVVEIRLEEVKAKLGLVKKEDTGVKMSPRAKEVAKGLKKKEIASIKGTGKDGRIKLEDVKAYIASKNA